MSFHEICRPSTTRRHARRTRLNVGKLFPQLLSPEGTADSDPSFHPDATDFARSFTMADFNEAFERIIGNREEYPEEQSDSQEEKYRGISRRFCPSWAGWGIVDALRRAASNEKEFRKTLEQNEKLKQETRSFFKQIYWDRFWGDRIPDQTIAEELFDTSLTLGVHSAVCFLQEGLSLLSGQGEKHVSLLEDGCFGPLTMETLEAYLETQDASDLLKVMNILQSMHYIEYLRRKPSQQGYVRTFLKRTRISKDFAIVKPPAPPTDFRIE